MNRYLPTNFAISPLISQLVQREVKKMKFKTNVKKVILYFGLTIRFKINKTKGTIL